MEQLISHLFGRQVREAGLDNGNKRELAAGRVGRWIRVVTTAGAREVLPVANAHAYRPPHAVGRT